MQPTLRLCERIRRIPLTTKIARKGFYKGNGVGILGGWDPENPRKFVPDWNKVRTYKFPEKGLAGFELTPFVSKNITKNIEEGRNQWSIPLKKLTGEEYLEMWKGAGGHDFVEVEQPRK